jgi:Tfp pilus assembly protein PilN
VNFKSALEHFLKGESMLNSFTHNPVRNELLFSERQYDNQKNELQKLELQKERLFLCICLLLVFLILLSLVILLLRKNQRHKEDSEMIDLLQNEAVESNSSLLLKLEKESKLKVSIEKLIDNIKFLSDASYQFEDRPSTFMNVFRNRVKLSKLQNSMLDDLRFFLDEKYNNIITNLSNQYPILSDDELNFISLICFGFSFAAITVCMGYTNINYVNNKKIRIAKKMKLKEPLRQYLNKLLAQVNPI